MSPNIANAEIQGISIYDLEQDDDKAAQTANRLIKANHINYSILYNDFKFHNHCSHIIGSAYILGATSEHLKKIYTSESEENEAWKPSPAEISEDDWKDFLGRKEYLRAYVDFFEDRLAHHGYDWRELMDKYLLEGEHPLINNVISGLAHPLIHLGYAYELSSPTIAVEALAMIASSYDYRHKYLDDPKYTKSSQFTTTNLEKILIRVQNDSRLTPHDSLETREDIILEYWNSWDITSISQSNMNAYRLSALLLVGCGRYDFFFCHALTAFHAVRTLLTLMSAKPQLDNSRITDYDLKGRDWEYVTNEALNSKWCLDAHFVKACRALRLAAQLCANDDDFFLKAAVRFVDEFDGWKMN